MSEAANIPTQEDNLLNVEQSVSRNEADELHAATGGVSNDDDAGTTVDLDDLDEEVERSGRVDNELEEAGSDTERQQIIEERKNRNKDRRQRQRDRFESLQREVAQMKRENHELAQRLARGENFQRGAQYQELERAEGEVETLIGTIERALEAAGSANDGVQIARLSPKLIEARQAKERLAQHKQSFVDNARREATRTPAVDPVLQRNSTAWRDRNKWYQGPKSGDLDSVIATAVDNDMAKAGWNPSTDEYWVEFDKRVRTRLPHRYESSQRGNGGSDDNSRQQNTGGERRQPTRQPVAGGGNEGVGGAQPGSKRQYIVSNERVRAMKESGAWYDPERKKAMIKSYMEYDKSHGII